jgi:hypothetical protein
MTAHADASPSSASIWINCAASVTKARGKRRLPTVYTTEGTVAHHVAELLIHGLPAPASVEADGTTVEVDDLMLEAVERYVAYAEELKRTSDIFLTEQLVAIDIPGTTESIYGTADIIAYRRDQRRIEVVDLKFGRGVEVNVNGNPQLLLYGLGALAHFRLTQSDPVEGVVLCIVQPRVGTGGENHEYHTVASLLKWRDEVLGPAVERIDLGDQTETVGPHCRWCVRAGECRSLAATRLSDARAVFAPVADPPLPVSLTDDELAVILDHAWQIEAWLEKIRAEASRRIDHGQAIPGWKLVAKRAMEKWVDADGALAEMHERFPGLVSEMVKLVTPAAVKRVLKADGHSPDVIAGLTTKESSGTTLARDDDSRPAVGTDAKSVFQQLTDSLAQT